MHTKRRKTKNHGPFKEKNNMTETIPKKAQTLGLLDKDFKSTVLNILIELKEK